MLQLLGSDVCECEEDGEKQLWAVRLHHFSISMSRLRSLYLGEGEEGDQNASSIRKVEGKTWERFRLKNRAEPSGCRPDFSLYQYHVLCRLRLGRRDALSQR